jgi:hypothetical protein
MSIVSKESFDICQRLVIINVGTDSHILFVRVS